MQPVGQLGAFIHSTRPGRKRTDSYPIDEQPCVGISGCSPPPPAPSRGHLYYGHFPRCEGAVYNWPNRLRAYAFVIVLLLEDLSLQRVVVFDDVDQLCDEDVETADLSLRSREALSEG